MRRVRPTYPLRCVVFGACVLGVVTVLQFELDTVWQILALAFSVAGPLAIEQLVLRAAASSESQLSSRWFVDLDMQRLEAMKKMLSKGTKGDRPAR